jgi:hypothetical protein
MARAGVWAIAITGTLCLRGAAVGDEAWLRDGLHMPGALGLVEGRLRFTPRSSDPPPAESLLRISLGGPEPPPLRIGDGRRIVLLGGQRLTGQLVRIDGETVRLRTSWASPLDIPRAGVVAITALPGWRLRFADDFDRGLRAWETHGKPTTRDAPALVLLDTAGQDLTHILDHPIKAGRIAVNFAERDNPREARWQLEAVFRRGDEPPALVQATVAGAGDHYTGDVVGLRGEAVAVRRTEGSHRLAVQFTPRSLRITCDDQVLWYTLESGPAGSLRQVRLCCSGGTVAAAGSVAWSAFTIEEAVDESPWPGGELSQDEVCLDCGDQLFGRLAGGDRREVILERRRGRRSLPWTALRGCRFRRQAPPARSSDGAHVRLLLDSGLTPEKDVLDGVLLALDDKDLTLRHDLLGELRLPRGVVKEVRPFFHGRRIELDNGVHHLGPAGRLTPGLEPARAEGPVWETRFALDLVPDSARLILEVLDAPAGEPRTEVVVNDRSVGYFKRQTSLGGSAPRRTEVALPRDAFREGDNTLRLRQTPDSAPRCVGRITLEIPR